MELNVPSGLYGMAVAEPAALDRNLDGSFMYCVEFIRVQSMLWLNYFVICLFLLQLWKMNQERTVADCSERLLLLELGCVFLFEVRMLVDVRKSVSIMSLLWAAPWPVQIVESNRYRSTRAFSPKAGAILAREQDHQASGMLSRMFNKIRRNDSGHGSQWKLDGISCIYRFWCMLTVAIPVLLLSVALAYLGGVYIMRSSNDGEMMMNTLAVVFVAEIEEFLYVAFTSDAMRYNLENMQPVMVGLTNRQRLVQWFGSSILCPLLTVCAATLVVYHARMLDCHEFTWNMQAAIDGVLDVEIQG